MKPLISIKENEGTLATKYVHLTSRINLERLNNYKHCIHEAIIVKRFPIPKCHWTLGDKIK